VVFELVGERAKLQELGRLRVLLEEVDGAADHAEVRVDLLDDARPPHLQDDLTAVA
jgi:hypothetical protein